MHLLARLAFAHPLPPHLACRQVLDPQWLLEWQARRDSEADPASLALLRANGLAEEEARAALRHCRGNIDRVGRGRARFGGGAATGAAGVGCCVTVLHRPPGSACAVSPCPSQAVEYAAARQEAPQRRGGPSAADAARAAAEAAAVAQRRALEAEVEGVLHSFEGNGGIARSRVQRIERVESLVRWSKYCRWVAEWVAVGRCGAAGHGRCA